MNVHPRVRSLARWGRGMLLPMRSVRHHLTYLVHRTGKELHFQSSVIERLENDTEVTLGEMGIMQ